MSLVHSYFAAFPDRLSALEDLNVALGTAYKHNAISRWMQGKRDPDWRTRAHMLNRVLPGVLREHGAATPADVDAALDKLL
jgi:hypothetical protein